MAGSYKHVVTDDGRLRNWRGINGMLECNSGDVVECVEEMYGMIWYLAAKLANLMNAQVSDLPGGAIFTPDRQVEEARQEYKEGLEMSPGQQGEFEELAED